MPRGNVGHVYRCNCLLFLNVTRAGTSKASALRLLAAHHVRELAEVAAVGVGENDAYGLDTVGLAIAMVDAPAAIRQLCNVTVSPAAEGDLVHALDLVIES